jgi:hypothetical protein
LSTGFTEDTRPIQPVSANSASVSVSPPQRRRRRKRGPRWLRKMRRALSALRFFTVFIALIAVAAVVAVGTLVVAADAQTKVQASYSNLTRILNTISTTPGNQLTLSDFNRLRDAVRELTSSLRSASRQTAFIRSFAQLNAETNAAVTALDASVQLASAAEEMLNGLQPTLFFLVSGRAEEAVVSSVSSGERIIELLELGRSQFLSAQQRLLEGRALIAQIQLDQLSTPSLLAVDELNRYAAQLEQINNILLQLPNLLQTAFGLGTTGDSSYLVLSQNNDEIRPSGGFISTFGWLVVRNGRIIDYNYRTSGSGSPNPPPRTLADQIPAPDWWIIRYRDPIYMAWDGSWYPDFPSTARMASWFYNNGSNPRSPVDGVIAIDINGFLYILDALGDVSVPAYGVVVNTNNFRNVVYNIRAYSPGLEPHKDFIAAVYAAIFERWQTLSADPKATTRIFGAVLQALQEKHIMLYFADERLNEAVNLLGWSGQQTSGVGHDYLMVVDANLGNKSNSSIFRQITYDLDLQPDGTGRARTTITYDYPERAAASDPAVDPEFHGQIDYFNMLQVFMPLNTTLTGISENTLRKPIVYSTPTHTNLVTLMSVPYNSTKRLQLTYNTTGTVEPFGSNWRYRLLLQKQPGTRAESVNVQITLPPGAQVIRVTPEPAAQYTLERQLLEFRVNLSVDRWIEIIYRM